MRLRNAALAAIVLGCSLSALAQAPAPRRDGQWEVKIQMAMAGMTMPASTMMQCITPADAADPAKSVPQQPGSNCKMTDYKLVDNKATFIMTCEGPNPGTMNGEFIYGDGTYTGTMKMEMSRGGQPMAMAMNFTGKRIGDCVK